MNPKVARRLLNTLAGLAEALDAALLRMLPAISLAANVSRHTRLADRYIKSGRSALAVDLLVKAPQAVRRTTSIVFLLERALRISRNHLRARTILEEARADDPSNPEILVRLSDLYKYDGQFDRAQALLMEVESLGLDQSVRRICLETAAKNFSAGRETLRQLMKARGKLLLQGAPAVDEFAHHYRDLESEVIKFREIVRETVGGEPCRLSHAKRLALSISCRMIEEAQNIHDDAMSRKIPINRRVKSHYRTVRDMASPVHLLGRLALENERSNGNSLSALIAGHSTTVTSTCDPDRVVELFIPLAFYDPTAPAIVRDVFQIIADKVAERQDIILVPRHQFNLRSCRPLLQGRTVSYHTRGAYDARHLRYKDGALLGYVTLDHSGYAGFASIATDFEQIRRAVANVPTDILYRTRAELYSELVETGKSKLYQPPVNAKIIGPYVFVALQMIDDEAAELAWMPSIELLNQVALLYRGTKTTVVVKRHPHCRSASIQAAMLKLEHSGTIVVSDASIHSLIAGAEIVFTVNSGVGLEAMVHGRPVIVSGLCDYAYGVQCVRNAEELAVAVEQGGWKQEINALEFLYYYTHRHAFKVCDVDRLGARVGEWLDEPLNTDMSSPVLDTEPIVT